MTAAGIDFANSRAILLGTSVYRDEKWDNVPAVVNSLHGMRSALTDPRLGGWPTDRVVHWLNRTNAHDVSLDLWRLARSTHDVLIFYFAGHGTPSSQGRLCLLLPDSSHETPNITGLEYDRVRDAVIRSRARIKIVILDCCYSGRAIDDYSGRAPEEGLSSGDVADFTLTRGAYTLTASNTREERARWAPDDDAPTSFTDELLKLIYRGLPTGPELLTLTDLEPQLRVELLSRRLPEPHSTETDMGARLAFTRNVAYRAPGAEQVPLPPPEVPPRPWRERSPWTLATRMNRRDALKLTATAVVAGGAAVVGVLALRPAPNATARVPAKFSRLGNALDYSGEVWQVAAGQVAGKPIAVTGGSAGEILVWDLTTLRPVNPPLLAHKSGIRGLTVATVGGRTIAVSGDQHGTVMVWDLAAHQQLRVLSGHTDQVWPMAVTTVRDKNIVISGSEDKKTLIWDLDSGALLKQLAYPARVIDVAVTNFKGTPAVVMVGEGNTVQVWSLDDYQSLTPPAMNAAGAANINAVSAGTFNNQPVAVTGDDFGSVRLWHLETGADTLLHRDLDDAEHAIDQWATAIGQAHGQTVVLAGGGADCYLWNLTTGSGPTRLRGNKNSVWSIALAEINGHLYALTGCLATPVGMFELT
jgi:Caspase domain/WD domain, G-beta repeat